MNIGIIVASFVALTLAAWLLERVFDHGLTRSFRAIKRRLVGSTKAQIDGLIDSSVTSKFATSIAELETVLNLRKAYFHDNPIVPDEAYHKCHEINRFCFKLVLVDSSPVGYWGVIPITKQSFEDCRNGRITHEEILTQHALAWDSITGPLFLYFIGAVVPLIGDVPHQYLSLLKGLLSKYVILDIYDFAQLIGKTRNIGGVLAWPSRTGGLNALRRTKGFKQLETAIGGDSNRPIYELNDTQEFRQFIQAKIDKHIESVPAWNDRDRNAFLDLLESTLAGNKIVDTTSDIGKGAN